MATIRRSPSGPFESVEGLPPVVVFSFSAVAFDPDRTIAEVECEDPSFVGSVTRGVLAFLVHEPGPPGPQGAGGNALGLGILGAFVKDGEAGTVFLRLLGEAGAEYENVGIGIMLLPPVEIVREGD